MDLVKVITWTSNETTKTKLWANINNPDNLVIPEQAFQSQKDISVALARSEKEKTVLPPAAKKKSVNESNKLTKPIISCTNDLIGKLVCQITDQDNESKEQKWVKVILLEKFGGVHYNPKFVLKPVDSEEVYFSNIYEDYTNGEVKVSELSSDDLIRATIDHLHTCWREDVVDIDEESENGDNPDFFVSYEDCNGEQSDWYLVPLKEDYLKGWVRFADIEYWLGEICKC